ncbi:MAG: hypothetical protein JO131_03705 [Gammaproteobacteria bacterium]|nr:hypothetical protein [Gammaproteobacteria bacterium]
MKSMQKNIQDLTAHSNTPTDNLNILIQHEEFEQIEDFIFISTPPKETAPEVNLNFSHSQDDSHDSQDITLFSQDEEQNSQDGIQHSQADSQNAQDIISYVQGDEQSSAGEIQHSQNDAQSSEDISPYAQANEQNSQNEIQNSQDAQDAQNFQTDSYSNIAVNPENTPHTSLFTEFNPIQTEKYKLDCIVNILKQESTSKIDKTKLFSVHTENHTFLHKKLKTSPTQLMNSEKETKPTVSYMNRQTTPASTLQTVWNVSSTLFCCCSTKKKQQDAHKKNDDISRPPNLPPILTI